ncbi:hypothetical protein L6V77_02395 [Myxococcota bacterium]|nr:hypothetical protein [Myxococcota bacterium]
MENEDRPEPPVADATEPSTDAPPAPSETAESSPEADAAPREVGRRRPSAEVEFELERLFALAVKYPEVGPSLAALCFKAGWQHFAERVVQSGVAGGPRGVEYYQIAVQSARRDGRPADVIGIVRDAVTELGTRDTLSPNDGARLLQLVRQGFSTLLFDLKDPRADLGFVSFLAEQWGELEGRLADDPLFHVLRAQLLWYADPAAAEGAWADAAERGDPELVWNARGTWAKDAERDIGAAEKAYRTGIDRAPQSALLMHNLAQLLMDRAAALTPPEGETELSAAQQKARNRDLQYADELLRRALRGDARGVRRHIHATLDRLTAMRPHRERPARGPQREARGPQREAREPREPREPRAADAPADAPAEPPPPPPVPESDYAYARITTAAIANQGDRSCPDFNGGGPDNAFAGLGAFVNGQLQTSINEQSLNLLPVSIGLPAGAMDGQFAIAVLTGSDQPDGSYIVSDAALDANGDPLILFNPAEADAGRLQAGPGNFTLQLPVQGVEVELNLTSASITGGIAVDANAGLTISTGTIAGQITQEDLDAALVVVPAEFQGLIPIFLQPDLDLDGNGTNDGYSLCLTFEATPATVIGYPLP